MQYAQKKIAQLEGLKADVLKQLKEERRSFIETEEYLRELAEKAELFGPRFHVPEDHPDLTGVLGKQERPHRDSPKRVEARLTKKLRTGMHLADIGRLFKADPAWIEKGENGFNVIFALDDYMDLCVSCSYTGEMISAEQMDPIIRIRRDQW